MIARPVLHQRDAGDLDYRVPVVTILDDVGTVAPPAPPLPPVIVSMTLTVLTYKESSTATSYVVEKQSGTSWVSVGDSSDPVTGVGGTTRVFTSTFDSGGFYRVRAFRETVSSLPSITVTPSE